MEVELPSASTVAQTQAQSNPRLCCIDGANVGREYTRATGAPFQAGVPPRCSARALAIAASWWQSRGWQAVVFLSRGTRDHMSRDAAQPDAEHILALLASDGALCVAPSGSYDDSFLLDHAKSHASVAGARVAIVSNDKFRDWSAKFGAECAAATSWLDRVRIPVAWAGDAVLFDADALARL